MQADSKEVATPGIRREWTPEDEKELSPEDATAYRACVARGNYLAQDRTDIQYAVKEHEQKHVQAHRRRLDGAEKVREVLSK